MPDPPELRPLRDAALPDADALELVDARVVGGTAAVTRVDVAGCELRAVTVAGGDVTPLRLADTVLRDCDPSDVRSRGASLVRVEAGGTRMVGLQLAHASLRHVRLADGTLELASLERCRLQHVVLPRVVLRDATFHGSELSDMVLGDCDLAGADVRGRGWRASRSAAARSTGSSAIEALDGLRMPWPDPVASRRPWPAPSESRRCESDGHHSRVGSTAWRSSRSTRRGWTTR